MTCTSIAIAGLSSEVGKTTLLCNLLREFSGWEAIKMTRGHYRSCGRDPGACCVSHLLSDEPVIRSGREQTYVCGKDTGRYWDAGASNVHWAIVTDNQVEDGIRLALERVNAPGVLIEGNSFLNFIDVDFAVVVAREGSTRIKSSARSALQKASALYLFDQNENTCAGESIILSNYPYHKGLNNHLPLYTAKELPALIAHVRQLHAARDVLRQES